MMNKTSIDPDCITYGQMNLIFNARMYYMRLTAWTRAYLLSRYFEIGNDEDIFGHLYFETLQLGDMLFIIHGRQTSQQYSQLLSQFAIALRDIINAQLNGNIEEVNRNVSRLYRIAAERRDFIQAINPFATPEYEDLFEIYIRNILEEANALAVGDYDRDIAVYDMLKDHAELLGDAFAVGIYNFITSGSAETEEPESQNGRQCITQDEMNTIFRIRMFRFEFVTWMRNYMLSRYRGLGNIEAVRARLLQVPVNYVNELKKIFGDLDAEAYIQLYFTYIDLFDAFITAQMENNIDEINRITRLLYQNAAERASFITSINPEFWDETEWQNIAYTNLRTSIDESTTFLVGDYARNIDIFRILLDQAESVSDYFAQGLFHYLYLYQI